MKRPPLASLDRRLRVVRNDPPDPLDRFEPTPTGIGYIAGRNGQVLEDPGAFSDADVADFMTGHRLAIDEKSGGGAGAIVALLVFFGLGLLIASTAADAFKFVFGL